MKYFSYLLKVVCQISLLQMCSLFFSLQPHLFKKKRDSANELRIHLILYMPEDLDNLIYFINYIINKIVMYTDVTWVIDVWL